MTANILHFYVNLIRATTAYSDDLKTRRFGQFKEVIWQRLLLLYAQCRCRRRALINLKEEDTVVEIILYKRENPSQKSLHFIN